MSKMSIQKEKIVFWSYQPSKTNQFFPMLTEIYYEVDEFNRIGPVQVLQLLSVSSGVKLSNTRTGIKGNKITINKGQNKTI